MKTNSILTIAAALTMGFSASAFANHNETHREQQRELQRHRTSRVQPSEQRENVFVSTVAYPFRFLGRTGRSVMNTPTIVGETWSGDRKFISKRGIMATRGDEIERRNMSDREMLNDEQRGVPQGRGDRRQLFPND